MTLEELGAALRAERERRRLNLEDVASRLKIPVRMLRALEDGDTASLPHLAYAKGFIRSYALFLGMVAEEVSEAADVLGDNIVPRKPVEIPVAPPAKSGSVNPVRVILAIFAIALFAAAGFSAWQPDLVERVMALVQDKFREIPVPRVMPAEEIASLEAGQNKPGVSKTGPGIAEDNKTSGRQSAAIVEKNVADRSGSGNGASLSGPKRSGQEPASQSTGQPAADQTRQDRKSGQDSNSVATAPGQKPGSQSITAGRLAAAENKKPAVSEKPARGRPASVNDGQSGLHRLILTATEACSVQSSADGTQNRQFAMRRGDTFALMFVKNLEVRIGNVKAVRLRYDGRDVELADGPLARTLQFPLVEGQ